LGTSTHYQLPWPEATDTADGPNGIGNLARKTDDTLFTTIWTPLNNRVTTLESQPATSAPGTQNGNTNLSSNLAVGTSWTDVLTTGLLAQGVWLIVCSTEVDASGPYSMVAVTIRLRNITASNTAAACTMAMVTQIYVASTTWNVYSQNAALSAIVAPPAGGYTFTLQAISDTAGIAECRATSRTNAEANATKMSWVKVA